MEIHHDRDPHTTNPMVVQDLKNGGRQMAKTSVSTYDGNTQNYPWLKEIHKLVQRYSLQEQTFLVAYPTQYIASRVWQHQQQEDNQAIEPQKLNIVHVPAKNEWINYSQTSKKVIFGVWARDSYSITGCNNMEQCNKCGTACDDWLFHILTQCNNPILQTLRKLLAYRTSQPIENIQSNLPSTNNDIVDNILQIISTWQRLPQV